MKTTNIKDVLAYNLRRRMEFKNIDVKDLAERSGVSERAIISMRNGHYGANIEKLDKVARELGTTPSLLLKCPNEN